MISLYKEGVYLLNGTEIIPESEASRSPAAVRGAERAGRGAPTKPLPMAS